MKRSVQFGNLIVHEAQHLSTYTTTLDTSQTITVTTTSIPVSTFSSSTSSHSTTSTRRSFGDAATATAIPPAPPPSATSQKALIGGIIAGICILALLGILLGFCIHRRNRLRNRQINELERPPPAIVSSDGRRVLSDVTIVYNDKEILARPTQPVVPSSFTMHITPIAVPIPKLSKTVAFKNEDATSVINRSIGQDSVATTERVLQSGVTSDYRNTELKSPLTQQVKDSLYTKDTESPLFSMRKNTLVTDDNSTDSGNPTVTPLTTPSKTNMRSETHPLPPHTILSQAIDESFQQNSVYLEETPPPTSTTFFSHWRQQTSQPPPPIPTLPRNAQIQNNDSFKESLDEHYLNKSVLSMPSPSTSSQSAETTILTRVFSDKTMSPAGPTTLHSPVGILSKNPSGSRWGSQEYSHSGLNEDMENMRYPSNSKVKGSTTTWYGGESDEE